MTVGLAGAVVVALAYLVFVPGTDLYSPMALGIGNRVNAVASIGWVLILYAGIRLIATMGFRRLRPSSHLADAFTCTCCVLVGVNWLGSVAEQADAYERAYAEGKRALDVVTRAVPRPPAGSTIWTFGQPVEMSPGIHVFANTWEMTFSAQVRYRDPTIWSFVGYPGTEFECRRSTGSPHGHPQYDIADPRAQRFLRSRYGQTFFVDTTTGRAERIGTRNHCRRASASFARSPQYPLASG